MISALDVWSMGEGRGAPTIYRTLKAFNDAGHTVHLVLPSPARGRASRSPDGLASLEHVRVHHVPRLLSPKPNRPPHNLARAWNKLQLAVLFPLLAAWEGRRILRREKIDVLYGYEVHGVLAASLLRRVKPIPLVTRFQGTILNQALRSPLSLARKVDHVIALKAPADLCMMTDDGTLGDVTLEWLNPSSRQRLRFWRNGIDLERFRPTSDEEAAAARKSLGIATGVPVVMAVSRLVWWKRQERVVRVWPQVMAKRPDAQLVLVGDGEERPRLEEMARALGVDGNVRFAGAVRQDEVLRYLQAADIFVSVNDLSNAGNPLMEAAACGKAIVTLNNGSTARLVEDGVTGILLAPDDDAALAGAILLLVEDGAQRRRLQEQARQFALENFWSWEERLAAEVQAVRQLVPEHSQQGT